MRPAISPGQMVLRRDVDHLQVGCNPGVVVRDRPGLYAFLRHLDGIRDLEVLRRHRRRHFPELRGDIEQVLQPLVAAGLVIDADARADGDPTPTVGIHYDVPATSLAGVVGQALDDLGVGVGPEPDVMLVFSTGEPRRSMLASLVRTGQPHLTVLLDGPAVRIGPWVAPGRTPCIGCLDRHRATWDPAWSALAPQFGQPVHAAAVGPAVRLAAAAVVADEVARFASGVQPRSWSSVLRVDASLEARVVGDSSFHPRCSCSVLLAA